MDKQIEEMAKDLCPLIKEFGSCEKCDDEISMDDEPCLYKCMAKLCIEKSYRKASDVVEEIFAEIEKFLLAQEVVTEQVRVKEVGEWILHDYLPRHFAELKKKYTKTEGGE